MYDGHKYIDEGYTYRLLKSFLFASLLTSFAAHQFPKETDEKRDHNLRKVFIEYINPGPSDDELNDQGGGGGGGPADKQVFANMNIAIVLPVRAANPIISNKDDSSKTQEINIPTVDVGLGIGTGEGTGLGTGSGSGIGNGIGNGIGDGSGDGVGRSIIPPRPILMVMPEYPSAELKKKITGTIQLSVRVNIHGKVDSVLVLNNPTGSQACENSALQAAYASKYEPARSGNRAVVAWTKCDYGFSP